MDELREALHKAKTENAALKAQFGRIYVGGLPYTATSERIRSLFESSGSVASVELKLLDDGSFSGIAYVSFSEGIEQALERDGEEYEGRYLKIRKDQRAPPKARDGDSKTVYLGNLPWTMSENDVRDLISSWDCKVAKLRYHTDAESGDFKGFCHVEFADEASLTTAIAKGGSSIQGRELRVAHSVTFKKRTSTTPPSKKKKQRRST